MLISLTIKIKGYKGINKDVDKLSKDCCKEITKQPQQRIKTEKWALIKNRNSYRILFSAFQ